jgi:hypothetical protein
MKKYITAYVATAVLACAGASAQAQLPVPIIGDILGGGSTNIIGQTLSLADSLLDPQILVGALSVPQGLDLINDPLSGLSLISSLGGDFVANPSNLLTLGRPLVTDLIPILGVLIDDPASSLDYLLYQGGIFPQSLAPIPSVPILSSPIL